MATTSPSLCETSVFNKNSKGKHKNKGSKAKEEILTSKSEPKSKVSKESSFSELPSSKSLVSSIQEPVWDTEYSEVLSVPVPDLYPELSESLPNMQESDTEQGEMAKVREPDCDNEDMQCVPTSCDDSLNDARASQSQDDSQLSNTGSQAKQKRKRAKPKKVRKRKGTDQEENSGPLDDLQVTSKQGTWAQCSVPSCGKWRFLHCNVDPNELPERWVCAMNENEKYNECSVSQETFDSQEGDLDVMYTPYPSGAIVWAKMVGYPWWPAMMEDDPDYGYYCETGEDNVTPEMYHVVFFDKEVSRTWVNAVCIRNFSCDEDPEDMGKVTFKGKNYRRQLTTATLAARRAAQLPLQRRLAEYGFAARYKGPIGRKAVEESKRLTSLETGELSDSVTDSSSQDFSSSGNSYSSPDEIKRVKPKTPLKSKTPTEKAAKTPIKNEKKKVQRTKKADSDGKEEEAGKKKGKKAKKATTEASVTIQCDDEEFVPENNVSTSADSELRPEIEQRTEGHQGKSEKAQIVLDNRCEAPVANTLNSKTYSGEAIGENVRSTNKPSVKKLAELNSSETKVVKKRKKSDETVDGKKPKKSKEDGNLLENSATNKEHEKADADVNLSLKTLIEKQKKRTACEESSRKKKIAATKIEKDSLDTAVGEDQKGDNSVSPGTSKLSDSKENHREETVSKTRDNPTGDADTECDNQCLESGVKGADKEIVPGCLTNKTNKKSKKKTAVSSVEENEVRESRKGSEEEASSSEGSDQKGASGDGLHSENHLKPQQSSFALKRSSASTDVRVSLTENVSQKKSLPKLVKAFKPPISKEGKGPKMPKLLKPQFVSPALAAKNVDRHDARKEESGKALESNTAKKSLGTTNGIKFKSKSPQHMVQSHSETSKEESHQASNILPEDLEAEIEEIDNDIASMQKELRVSDTSDTSTSEERVLSPTAYPHQFLSDSPEF